MVCIFVSIALLESSFFMKESCSVMGRRGMEKDGRGYTQSWEADNHLAFIHILFGDENYSQNENKQN